MKGREKNPLPSGRGGVKKRGYDRLARTVHDFARYEGFDAHANAVSGRRESAFEGPG